MIYTNTHEAYLYERISTKEAIARAPREESKCFQ